MNEPHIDARVSRPLEALGISEIEKQVYRVLLAHHMATAEDIAEQLLLMPGEAQHLLDSIEANGLATHSHKEPHCYIAAPPELTIEINRNNPIVAFVCVLDDAEQTTATVRTKLDGYMGPHIPIARKTKFSFIRSRLSHSEERFTHLASTTTGTADQRSHGLA